MPNGKWQYAKQPPTQLGSPLSGPLLDLGEFWKTVPGWPSYEVNSIGQVRSVDRKITDSLGRTRIQYGRVKRTSVDDGGYRRVELSHAGQRIRSGVHRLVALAFIGPPAEGQETRHLDGDSLNNCVENLAWGSHEENMGDTIRLGRYRNGNSVKERCPRDHPYSGDTRRGRICHECKREAQRAYRERKAAR